MKRNDGYPFYAIRYPFNGRFMGGIRAQRGRFVRIADNG